MSHAIQTMRVWVFVAFVLVFGVFAWLISFFDIFRVWEYGFLFCFLLCLARRSWLREWKHQLQL